MEKYLPSEKAAICAVSFFRARHLTRRKFASGRRTNQIESLNREHVRMARHYVAKARRLGFRGSVRSLVLERV